MIKRGKLILSLVMLVVCICTLTFGVLAATTLNMSTGGEIGFISYDVDVNVAVTVTGAVKSDGITANNPSFTNQKISDQQLWTMPDQLWFNESAQAIPSIVFNITVTNNSPAFAVKATATISSGFAAAIKDKVSFTAQNQTSIAKESSALVKITLSVLDSYKNGAAFNFPSANMFTIAFERI